MTNQQDGLDALGKLKTRYYSKALESPGAQEIVDEWFNTARHAICAAAQPVTDKEVQACIKPLQWSVRARKGVKFCTTAVGHYEIGEDGFVFSPFVCKYPSYEEGMKAVQSHYEGRVLTLIRAATAPKNCAKWCNITEDMTIQQMVNRLPMKLVDYIAELEDTRPSPKAFDAPKGVVDTLKDAHDFVDCDKEHRNPEIATYAKRVCKQIKESLALLDKKEGE